MKVKLRQIPVRIISSVLIIFVSSLSSLIAQNNDIRFNQFTIEDGLSQNSVYAILQDHNGFMWFGTRTGGLNRFNGYSFTSYKNRANDSLSISSNEVLALCEDKHGMIWIGTRNGSVSRYDENYNHFINYKTSDTDKSSISSKTVSCIFEDSKGTLWFGTNYGLCEYNREEDNFIRHSNTASFKSLNIKAILQAGEDLLWLGSRRGIFLYNTQSREILKHYIHEEDNPISLSGSRILSMAIDSHGKLWAGTYNSGLNRLDDFEKGVFMHFKNDLKNKNSIASNVVRTLHFDKNSVLWVGTKMALDKVLPDQQISDNPVFTHYTNDRTNSYSISQNSIFSFYEAENDNLWVGGYIGGVNHFYNGQKKFKTIVRNLQSSNTLGEDVVSSFAETKEKILFGTIGGGLYLFNPKTEESSAFPINMGEANIFENNHIKALCIDVSGNIWVGTYKGLYLYDKKLSKFIKCAQERNIYSITEGILDEIWIGTNEGLFKVDKSSLKVVDCHPTMDNNKGIVANDIQKVYKDSNGRIWIAAKSGLYKYNRQDDSYEGFFHSDINKHSLSHSYCTTINEDTEGNIWIGTLDGLNRLNEKSMQFEHLGEAGGLPDNVVNNILFDDQGHLWITTNKGLSKIEKSVFLNKAIANSISKIDIRNFDIEDGLVCPEFRQNAAFKNSDGKLFFGGSGGFNFFHPDSIVDNPHVPKTAITSFKLFNKEVIPASEHAPISKPIWLTKSITLSYKQSVIGFEFAAFNYTSPLKNQYAYMLEGYDKEWNYIGTKHEATYTSLPAGKYVFRVKASNNDGLWNTEGSSLEIKITPPVWGRWWFRIMAAGVIFALIALYFTKRIRKEKKLNHLLEEKVSARTAELREKNNLLSQKTKTLNESNKNLIDRQKLIEKQTKEIKIQNDKLVEANLVKDKLFSVIGHDLKNPFNSIVGFSDLLVKQFHDLDDPKKLSFAKSISDSSKIVFDLINSLLLWSRSQRGIVKPKFQLHNVFELLEHNTKIANLQAKDKNIQISITCEDKGLQTILDADLINTLIRNLLSNAIKFTNPDGQIVLSCFDEGENIIVSIKDNGVGISKEAQRKLFSNNSEHISYGTNNEKGTGLGLLICQDFINLHQGKIWVNSEIDKGSEFSFSLPIKLSS